MAENAARKDTALKKAMREPNAIGWIAFLILMAGIGVGTVLFDRGDESGMSKTAHVAGTAGISK